MRRFFQWAMSLFRRHDFNVVSCRSAPGPEFFTTIECQKCRHRFEYPTFDRETFRRIYRSRCQGRKS